MYQRADDLQLQTFHPVGSTPATSFVRVSGLSPPARNASSGNAVHGSQIAASGSFDPDGFALTLVVPVALSTPLVVSDPSVVCWHPANTSTTPTTRAIPRSLFPLLVIRSPNRRCLKSVRGGCVPVPTPVTWANRTADPARAATTRAHLAADRQFSRRPESVCPWERQLPTITLAAPPATCSHASFAPDRGCPECARWRE